MPADKAFVDTDVLLYLFSGDTVKANRAEDILQGECVISVQVLNEFTNVARRKLGLSWAEIDDILGGITSLYHAEPLTLETHRLGRQVAERYQLSLYDAMIIASALLADCGSLYSEDMQHGLVVEKRLTIHNPFDPDRQQ